MHLTKLLEYAYLAGGFTTRSDFARENAEQVAEALGITVEEAVDRAERYLGPEHKRHRDGVTRVQ